VIDDKNGGPATDIPFGRYRSFSAAAVPEGTPGDFFLLQDLFELFPVFVAIYANEDERLSF
jgi:hypothetical protein